MASRIKSLFSSKYSRVEDSVYRSSQSQSQVGRSAPPDPVARVVAAKEDFEPSPYQQESTGEEIKYEDDEGLISVSSDKEDGRPINSLVGSDDHDGDDAHLLAGGRAMDAENGSDSDSDSDRHIRWLIYIICVADTYADSSDTAVLPEMCEHQFGVSPQFVGASVGAVQGLYNFSQFLSGFYLGYISDRYGRKPLLILGLIACTVGTFSFGFAKSIYVALFIRGTAGLMNAIYGTSKAYLSDITANKPSKVRSATFIQFGAVYSASIAFVTACAGYLSTIRPWAMFPYAMPLVIGSVPILIATVLAYLFLPESLPNSTVEKGGVTRTANKYTLLDGMQEIRRDRLLLLTIFLYGLNNFCNGGILVGIILVVSSPIEDGGLGVGAQWSGSFFTYLGLFGVFFQAVFYNKLAERYNSKTMYRFFGCYSQSLACIFLLLSPLPQRYSGTVTWTVVLGYSLAFIGLTFCSVGFMMCLPNCNTFITNASNPLRYGMTQGAAQSIGSLCRSVGPTIVGILFSVSSHYLRNTVLPFITLGVLYAVCGTIASWLPESIVEPPQKPASVDSPH